MFRPGVARYAMRGAAAAALLLAGAWLPAEAADPAVGMRSERVGVFENQWSGIFFLILTHADVARASFNEPKNWALAPEAPNSLARFAVDLTTLRQIGAGNPNIF